MSDGGSIIIRKVIERPRAVAVVLGHLGVNQETMEHYAQWYTDRHCSVVTGTSPPARFTLNQSLKPTALQVWSETCQVLRDTPSHVPLVIHLFSNGGAFLLEEMELLLLHHQSTAAAAAYQQPATAATTSTDEASSDSSHLTKDDYDLIAQRLKTGYQFFDCCPCYIRMAWDWSNFSQSFPHPAWSSWGRGSYTLVSSSCLTMWCTATLSWNRPSRFWERMLHSQVCLHNIYAYTTMDLATDAFKLEQLIEHRRTTLGADCKTYRFEDSNHCRLARDHPDEYNKAIDEALEAAVQRNQNPTDAS
ncbi:hypothetical protein ACA910_006036 [Epithemia clementina (nom. ined.)]